MKIRLLALTAAVLCGCRLAPQLRSERGSGILSSASGQVTTQEKDGATSGAISSKSGFTQQIQAGSASTIVGAAAAFAPGTLAIDTTVTIEEASPVATTASLSNLGLGSDTGVQSTAKAVVVESSAKADPAGTVAVTVPLPDQASLTDTSLDNLVIVFRVIHYSDGGTYFDGIIPLANLKVAGKTVTLQTTYFGAFQAAILTKKLDKAPDSKPAVAPILTANAANALPTLTLASITATLDSGGNVSVGATLGGSGTLASCLVIADQDKTTPFDSVVHGSTSLNASVTGLTAGTYFFRVDCIDQAGRSVASDWSTPVSVGGSVTGSPIPPTADTTPPKVPASPVLTVTAVTGSGATLTWGKAVDDQTPQSALRYTVWRLPSGVTINSFADVVAKGSPFGAELTDATSYMVTTMLQGTTTSAIVTVKDAAGNSAVYGEETFTTLDVTSPTTSGGTITVTAKTATSVSLSWPAATDNIAASNTLFYQVFLSGQDNIGTVSQINLNGSPITGNNSAGLSTTIGSLSSGVLYYFNVLVKDPSGNFNSYNRVAVTTLDTVAPTPGGSAHYTIGTVTPTSVALTWAKATDNLSQASTLQYQVYYSTANNLTTVTGAEANGTAAGALTTDIGTKVVTGLAPFTTYYFAVVVRDEAGNKAVYTGSSAETQCTNVVNGSFQCPLSLAGQVTTIFGAAGSYSNTNATGAAARFHSPTSLTFSGQFLYVADTGNNLIRKIDPITSIVTTFAGSSSPSDSDGTGVAAGIAAPCGILYVGPGDNTGYLYVTDGGDHIRRIDLATAAVTTIAGGTANSYGDNATGTNAAFAQPCGMASDGTSLYVADGGNVAIRKVSLTAPFAVSTIAGTPGTGGTTDNAVGTAATFGLVNGLALSGTTLFVSEDNDLRTVSTTGTNPTATISALSGACTNNTTGTSASFESPWGMIYDGAKLYLVEKVGQALRSVLATSTFGTTTVAGTCDSAGTTDATGLSATFNSPTGVVSDGVSLWVVDRGDHTIRRIQ